MNVPFVKLTHDAIQPRRSTPMSAGLDLFSTENTVVLSRSQAIIPTGISMALHVGTYGRIAGRSGIAVKNSIDVLAGVIDSDFRGEIKVVLFNHSERDFTILKGEAIAQLIIEKITLPELIEVSYLPDSERNSRGFGSTERDT